MPQQLCGFLSGIGIYMNNDGLFEQYLYIGYKINIAEKNWFGPLIDFDKNSALTLAQILAQGMFSQMAQDYIPN